MVIEVEQQPVFEARGRDDHTDTRPSRVLDSGPERGVVVMIHHTPDRVIALGTVLPAIPSPGDLSFLDYLERIAANPFDVTGHDVDRNGPQVFLESSKVLRLGVLTLAIDQNPLPWCPCRPTPPKVSA
nr:hypothetical protein [Alloactinosynnema sp. L-07]